MNLIIRISIISFIVLTQFSFGQMLSCYQCSSANESDCSEIFDAEHTKLKPTPCEDIYEAQYCIKTTGIYEGQIGTLRFCSSRKFEDYCDYIRRIGDIKPLRSCIFSCSSDGCNRGHNLFNINTNLLAIFLTLSFLTSHLIKIFFQ